jgi:hypothetical protein
MYQKHYTQDRNLASASPGSHREGDLVERNPWLERFPQAQEYTASRNSTTMLRDSNPSPNESRVGSRILTRTTYKPAISNTRGHDLTSILSKRKRIASVVGLHPTHPGVLDFPAPSEHELKASCRYDAESDVNEDILLPKSWNVDVEDPRVKEILYDVCWSTRPPPWNFMEQGKDCLLCCTEKNVRVTEREVKLAQKELEHSSNIILNKATFLYSIKL